MKTILNSSKTRTEKAKEISQRIAQSCGYSWVGLYDVTDTNIQMIACSSGEPAFPTFPKEQGLNGRAVKNKKAVVVNDVSQDPAYLTTFGKTQSEIIIPIISRITNEVIGTIDVESHFKNAFEGKDIEVLTKYAAEIDSLWNR